MINPMNSQDMWERSSIPPMKLPKFTKKTGRPKKLRTRAPDEPPKNTVKLKRNQTTLSCSRCGGQNHNKRSCKAALPSQAPVRKKRKGNNVNVSKQHVLHIFFLLIVVYNNIMCNW